MLKVRPHKAGLILGSVIGAWQIGWSAVVALTPPNRLATSMGWLGSIEPLYVFGQFNNTVGSLVLVATAALGYGIGVGFAVLWNRLQAGYAASVDCALEELEQSGERRLPDGVAVPSGPREPPGAAPHPPTVTVSTAEPGPLPSRR